MELSLIAKRDFSVLFDGRLVFINDLKGSFFFTISIFSHATCNLLNLLLETCQFCTRFNILNLMIIIIIIYSFTEMAKNLCNN